MPKKFRGENTKAETARARKAAVQHAASEARQKAKEDEYWHDDDKMVARKQQRKNEKEAKKLELAAKKKEKQELYEKDAQESVGKKSFAKQQNTKITRAEIQRNREKEEAKKKSTEPVLKRNVSKQDDLSNENINHVLADDVSKGSLEARTVEDAINVLSVDDKLDRHPERRQKAAYNKFEEENMERIKFENPNMRLSQWKQILFREWKKSPENPMNQKSLAYNAKD